VKLSSEVLLIDRRKLARVATGTAVAGLVQLGSGVAFSLATVLPGADRVGKGMLDVALSLLEIIEGDDADFDAEVDEDEDDEDTEVMERKPAPSPRFNVN
jgi:hypothetical protein